MASTDPYLDMPWASPVGGPPAAPAARLATAQDLNYQGVGGVVQFSVPLGPSTTMIRLCVPASATNAGVRIAIGRAGTLSIGPGSAFMTPGMVEYYKCSPGDVVGAVSQDANVGFVNIVECASVSFP